MATIDIDYSIFETKEKLIDDALLMRRNRIAHGERIAVEPEDYNVIEHETRELIDFFQELIEKSVQTEQYRAVSPRMTTPAPP